MPANPRTDGEITPASYSPCGLADHARRLTQHRGPPRFSNTPGMKMRDALVTHSLCATCGRVWILAGLSRAYRGLHGSGNKDVTKRAILDAPIQIIRSCQFSVTPILQTCEDACHGREK